MSVGSDAWLLLEGCPGTATHGVSPYVADVPVRISAHIPGSCRAASVASTYQRRSNTCNGRMSACIHAPIAMRICRTEIDRPGFVHDGLQLVCFGVALLCEVVLCVRCRLLLVLLPGCYWACLFVSLQHAHTQVATSAASVTQTTAPRVPVPGRRLSS